MTRLRVSKKRRAFEIVLLLAGLAGVGVWGWSHFRLSLFQATANRALEHTLSSNRPKSPATGKTTPPPALKNGELVGRLVIPRIKVRAVVREGAGHDTLDVALGHIPGTAMPGSRGNVGVAGHRDTLFRGLRNIAKNDVIQFQTPNGKYEYQVVSSRIVTPRDVGVLNPGPDAEMTLVTCYPFNYIGSAPDRFIVKARLLDPPQTTAATVPTATGKVSQVAVTKTQVATAKPLGAAVKNGPKRVAFQISDSGSRELVPGVRLSISSTDANRRRADGWISVARGGHPIWLRNLAVRQPLMFGRRELMLTSVTRHSASVYLLQF